MHANYFSFLQFFKINIITYIIVIKISNFTILKEFKIKDEDKKFRFKLHISTSTPRPNPFNSDIEFEVIIPLFIIKLK